MKTKYKCKNFNKDYEKCLICISEGRYIILQNANCKSCFEPLLNKNKE